MRFVKQAVEQAPELDGMTAHRHQQARGTELRVMGVFMDGGVHKAGNRSRGERNNTTAMNLYS